MRASTNPSLLLLLACVHLPITAAVGVACVASSAAAAAAGRFLPLPAAAATQYLQLHVYLCAVMAYVTDVACAFY